MADSKQHITPQRASQTTQHDIFDVLVLGAGASGLMAAFAASGGTGKVPGNGPARRVGLLDHAARPGLKLNLSGGGKANVTNLNMQPQCFTGEDVDFCGPALDAFPPESLLALLDGWGIGYEEREFGQIFCTQPAKRLTASLERACLDQGCEFFFNQSIQSATKENGLFRVATLDTGGGGGVSGRNAIFHARKLIIALGGPAWPSVGASGTGAELARAFGHVLLPFRPVLVPLRMPTDWPLLGLEGISLDAVLSPSLTAQAMPLLFTHQGISGPAALTASCLWRPGAELRIDFLPGQSLETLLDSPANGKRKLRHLLKGLLPNRLAERLADLTPHGFADRNIAELPRAARQEIVRLVHEHAVLPTGTAGFARAEAAAGGVRTADFSPYSLESRLVPGLFCTGEVLDITGMLGGYNLHWAFAGGMAAGMACAMGG